MHVSAPKHRIVPALALAMLALGLLGPLGCDGETEAADEQGESAQQGEGLDKAGPAAPEGPGPAAGDEGREPIEEAIGSDSTAVVGDDPCESAYGSMRATIDAMNKRNKTGNEAAMPPKERFMAACAELPARMQRCMDIRYNMAHQAECKKVADGVDPALQKRVQEMMGKAPGGGTPSE